MSSELIMCVQDRRLSSQINYSSESFIAATQIEIERTLDAAGVWLGPRDVLESMEQFRQIIPYVILTHNESAVVYQRSSAGGEERLHGLSSLGVGGHIDFGDVRNRNNRIHVWSTINNAAERELREELVCGEIKSRTVVGWVCENHTAVSRVHVGIICLWELASDKVAANCPEVENPRLVPFHKLGDLRASMESWSQYTVDMLSDFSEQDNYRVG